MSIKLFSSSISTLMNITNSTKIQRWIFGMIIGSAPFLLIVICWILVSICLTNISKYYFYTKKQNRYMKRNNINKTIIAINSV